MAAKKTKSAKAESKVAIGIIGGSGLYSMSGLTKTREIRVKTPSAIPRTRLCSGHWRGSAWRFWRATARASHPAGRD